MGDSKHDPKQKFSHETELDHTGLVELLEDLLAGIRSGELALEHGRDAIQLRPFGAIRVEIDAKHKPGRETLRLELEWEPEIVEPVLKVGPVPEPTPIEARRRSVVALRQARRPEPEPAPNLDDIEIVAEVLARLPKERLYELAQLVELEGRSQLHKTALARALCEQDLREHLTAEDARLMLGTGEP